MKKKNNAYAINLIDDLFNAIAAGDIRKIKIILADMKWYRFKVAALNIF